MKNIGIHVLDFNDKIIDYISRDDGALIHAVMSNNAEEKSETFDFTVVNKRASKLRERNRIIAQDNNGIYREFVISHVVDNFDGTTDIESNASYLEDIDKSKPIKPGKYSAYSTSQALNETLRNTGWEISEDTEHGGMRTTSWTSYSTPYEVINMLCTTYNMIADYSIELGSHTVEHRYVTLKQPVSLFKGKEITKGKDLTEMTRTVDMSEVRTALYAIGPENDKGERISVVVKDDEAQAQFGLPGRYLWSVYEPESDDSSMTEERLTTLAQTELNKRNQSAISYEISSIDIHKHYPEMVVSMHDTVRIKDRDFRPPLYIEAEVIGVDYDLILDESSYKFGNVVEYDESSLRSIFDKKIDEIRKKLNDNVTNINTIVNDAIQGELEYYEPKIIKSDTEPDNPIEDMLWYDTSNPNVAVLKRYHNGEWLNETAKDVEQLGGMTREHVLYNSITNTFQNLNIQHSKLLEEVTGLLNNEYLVDNDIKLALDNAQNNLVDVYNHIKDNLDSMNEDTATIGKLIDTQALFLRYRERLQDLYRAMRDAQVSADKRLKLLQSQYTDEKFNNAMDEVAKVLPNGRWDSEKGQLTADFPNADELENLRKSLQEYADGKISDLSSVIGEEIDSKINNTKNEISAHIGSVERKIDGIEVGGRNLLENSTNIKKNLDDETGGLNQFFRLDITHIHDKVKIGDDITISFDVQMQKGNILKVYDTNNHYDFMLGTQQLNGIGTDKQRVKLHYTLTAANKATNDWLLDFYNDNDATDKFTIENIKIERGTVATDWTPAPEDAQNDIKPLVARVTSTESDIKVLKDGLQLSATKKDVEETLNDQLQPIKNQVEQNSATLNVLPNEINSKVSKEDYTTDQNKLVTRLNNADSERKQLSNSISDKVSLTEYNSGISGAKSYTDNKVDNMNIGARNLFVQDFLLYNTGNLYAYRKISDTNTPKVITITDNDTSVDMTGILFGFTGNGANADGGVRWEMFKGDLLRNSDKDSSLTSYNYFSFFPAHKATLEKIAKRFKIKIEKGTVATDWTPAPEDVQSNIKTSNADTLAKANTYTDNKNSDVQKTLTKMNTDISQNGKDITLRATKEEFNASNKTLSKTISDFTNNVATGMTFTYDENGTIQSMNIGSDGIKLRGDKVDITVNKEFNVVAQNLNNKVGKDEIINRLNLSPEGLDIDVSKIGIRGGDDTEYISIKNSSILSYGQFTRTWANVTDTANLRLGINSGTIQVQNRTTGYNLYLTEKGLSTMLAGAGDDTAGTLEFHSTKYNDTSRGVRLHSTYGAVALESDYSRIILNANLTVNIESNYGIYFRPYRDSRTGNNEFAMYVKQNDSGAYTDGVLKYGNVSSDTSDYGSGIRFSKSSVNSIVYATNKDGDIGTGDFYGNKVYGALTAKETNAYVLVDGALRVTDKNGYDGGNTNYRDIQCQHIASNTIRTRTGKDFYIGVSSNELRVTNNLFWNGGDTGYKPIRASDYLPGSLERFKKDIIQWDGDALNEIVNNMTTYEYRLKDDEDDRKKRKGLVIGEAYKTPEDFIDGDGVSVYNMITYSLRAIQQLNEKIEKMEEQLNG